MRRLNIGCGAVVAKNWTNADIAPSVAGATQADVRLLPYDDEAFDIAAAHHVLQMLGYDELVPALAELRRVLRPGGWLRISVPSVEAGVRAWARNDPSWFPKIAGEETSLDGLFCTWVTDYGASRTVFTPKWLRELCIRAGFRSTHSAVSDVTYSGMQAICALDGRPRESAYVEAER